MPPVGIVRVPETELLIGGGRNAYSELRQFTGFIGSDFESERGGIDEHEALEEGFRDLVSHPWFIGGRTLDPKRMHMLYTACYDLDTFRSMIFESSFCDRFEIEPETLEEIKTNDEALLQFAFRWLRFALFAEPTMKVKEEAAERSKK